MFYFFHPVLYFVKRNILVEREKACDEYVLAVDRSKRGIYANALIDAAQICRSLKNRLTPLSVIAESFTDLKKRLIAIGTNTNPKARLSAKTLILLILISIICVPGMDLKARESNNQTDSQQRFTRIYDVAILIARPAHPDLRYLKDCNDPIFKAAQIEVAKLRDELIITIKETIEPNSWSDVSGAGTIEVHGEYRELAIFQTLEIHQKIKTLLDEMKRAKARTVQIEAKFIEVTEGFLDEIGLDDNFMQRNAEYVQDMFMVLDKVQFQRKRFEPGIADSEVSTSSNGFATIFDDLQISYLLRAVQLHKNSKMLAAPKITVLNGERAEICIISEIPYITLIAEPNESSEKPQQQVDFVEVGTKLRVLPEIRSNGDILLSIDLSFSDVIGDYKKRLYEDGSEYEVPDIEVLSLSTRIMLPDKVTLLIAGGKHINKLESGQIIEQNLLVLIKPVIIEPDTGNGNGHSELPARFSETEN